MRHDGDRATARTRARAHRRLFGLVLVLACASGAARPAHAQPANDSTSLALQGYARLARGAYADAVRGAEGLQAAVKQLLDRPSRETLAHAREAWIACQEPYGRTEALRFSGGPIDNVHPVTGVHGPELRINSWPVDEAYLDKVAGGGDGGLIADRRVPMDEAALVGRNGATEDAQVTLGLHAIEFLLWGQDRSRSGPGARPHSEFARGDWVRERRRDCLALMVDLLVRDLSGVAREWDPGPDRYVNVFLDMDATVALGLALSGPATLAAFELGSERIAIPLASGMQEDEPSCFSDNTHRDLASNVEGLGLFLEGDGANPGLLAALDATTRGEIRDRLARVRNLVYAIPPPFDAILLSPAHDPRRRTLQALSAELLGLAGALQRAGAAVGARVTIGGG